jgi:hypothetical protein
MKSTIILRQPTNDIYFLKHSMHNNLLSFGGGTWTTTSFPQSAQLILYDFGRIERPSLEPRCLPCLLICAISTSFLLFVYCLSQPFDSRPEGWSLPSARGFGLSVRRELTPKPWAPSSGSTWINNDFYRHNPFVLYFPFDPRIFPCPGEDVLHSHSSVGQGVPSR